MNKFIEKLKDGRGRRFLQEVNKEAENVGKALSSNELEEAEVNSGQNLNAEKTNDNCINTTLVLSKIEVGLVNTLTRSTVSDTSSTPICCTAPTPYIANDDNIILISVPSCTDIGVPNSLNIISDTVNDNFDYENEVTIEVPVTQLPDHGCYEIISVQENELDTDNNCLNSPLLEFECPTVSEIALNNPNEVLPLNVQSGLTDEEHGLTDENNDDNDESLANGNDNHVQTQEVLFDEEESESKKKSKKRVRNVAAWARNAKKLKVNTGEAYITKSGTAVEKKTIKTGCGEKCKMKCKGKINDEERSQILRDFLGLADVNRKRDYVSRLIDEVSPRYSYKKEGSHRSTNYSYHLILNNLRLRVCKKMFCDTLCISATYLTTVKKKTTPTGSVNKDARGKHLNHRKVEPDVVQGIFDHINSFPRIESHYCRADTKREYIDGDLDISEMYRLYKNSCIEKGELFAKKHKYDEIFNTKFNIGFFVPKKDQCSLCASYENSSEQEKEKMKDEMLHHKKEKELSRVEKKTDKELSRSPESNTIVACYDLQAVVQFPKGQISSFYYKRKLNAFNFSIYDLTSKQGHCYIWHEGCAKRGAMEIASFVYNFLKEMSSSRTPKIVFYSDNCSGQNKNHILVSMYLYAVQHLNILSVTHKYLIVGHTQNEGDAMHSSIEKQLKKATRKTPLYTPSQLSAIAQVANKEKNSFAVKEMDHADVYNWNEVEKSLGRNFQYTRAGERVVWAKIKVFEVRKETPNSVFYKTSYEEKEFKFFNTDDKVIKRKDGKIEVKPYESTLEGSGPSRKSKRQSSKKTDLGNLDDTAEILKPAYSGPTGVSYLKKADLISLCNDRLIPTPYHSFFHNLTVKNTQDDDGDV